MQSEYGIRQQMTDCIQSYIHCSVFCLQMSYTTQTGLNYSSWCQCIVPSVFVLVCVHIWRAFVCTICMCFVHAVPMPMNYISIFKCCPPVAKL